MPNSAIVILRNEVLPLAETTASQWQQAIQYGEGVFETMYWRKGILLSADKHLDRMQRGLHLLGIQNPFRDGKHFTETVLRHPLFSTRPHFARVRIQVSRMDKDECIILLDALAYAADPWPHPPVRLGLLNEVLVFPSLLSPFKTCNYLPYLTASRHAQQNGWDDCVVLGPQGVAETSRANLFAVLDGILCTPPLSSGCIAGVGRAFLMEVLGINNIPVVERFISVEELLKADCIFLTNSLRGVMPVSDDGPVRGNPEHPMVLAALSLWTGSKWGEVKWENERQDGVW